MQISIHIIMEASLFRELEKDHSLEIVGGNPEVDEGFAAYSWIKF